jgi:CRISPR-associated endonuclease Cas1
MTDAAHPNRDAAESSSFDSNDWVARNEHWLDQSKPSRRRAKRERSKEPLILCGHGVSLNIDRGTLFIRDGLTHYPQERTTYRFYPGDLALPPRIIMLDGSGSLSFEVIAWLAEQRIPLIRVDWRGEVVSAIGSAGFAQIPERVAWQGQTRQDPHRRLSFARDLIATKLEASLVTLNEVIPNSASRALAIAKCEGSIDYLRRDRARTIDEVRSIEANSAATYFNSWNGLPLSWRSRWKHPVPDAWLTIGSRRSSGRGRFASNRNATHPLNAMLNYAYAALRSQIHIEAAAAGFDPCRGIMHHDREDTQAFVYELIEPRRPAVDALILDFALRTPFSGADFVLRSDGVCRLTPQLSRVVTRLAGQSVANLPPSVDQIAA